MAIIQLLEQVTDTSELDPNQAGRPVAVRFHNEESRRADGSNAVRRDTFPGSLASSPEKYFFVGYVPDPPLHPHINDPLIRSYATDPSYLPYPPATGPQVFGVRDPVNQWPYLHGFTDKEQVLHVGWMPTVCTFAHEAITWDDRSVRRVVPASHDHEPDIGHDATTRLRAKNAMKYSRLLAGHLYRMITEWSEIDPSTDSGNIIAMQVRLPVIQATMERVCNEICVNPHWVMDFAVNHAPDPWDDALAEQSPIQQQPQEPIRRVYLPHVNKGASNWQPGALHRNSSFEIHQSVSNPLRHWEELIRQCSYAAARYRARYATRT